MQINSYSVDKDNEYEIESKIYSSVCVNGNKGKIMELKLHIQYVFVRLCC